MRISLEPRIETSRRMRILSPVIAALLTVIVGTVLFGALGQDPVRAFATFFVRPLSSLYGVAEWLLKATPLALCAIGLAIGFRGNVWNIGAEGQLTIGAICGGGVALAFYGEEGSWLLPAMLAAGAAGGLLWAMIPALLRARFNANEILTSLMLTYVAVQVLGYLVHGPWRDPDGYNFPETRLFGEDALLPILIAGTRLSVGSLAVIGAALFAWWLMARTYVGYQVTVVGQAPGVADFAGFSRRRVVYLSFAISGALAGLAGIIEVSGTIGQLQPVISPGYGFAAIIVAFLGRLHPVGVVAASLLMSLMYLGGESLQINMNLPLAVTGIFQGLLLFLVLATDVLVRYRVRIQRPAAAR